MKNEGFWQLCLARTDGQSDLLSYWQNQRIVFTQEQSGDRLVNAEAGIVEDCERYEQPAEKIPYTCTSYCDVHYDVKHDYIDLSSERNYKSKNKNT